MKRVFHAAQIFLITTVLAACSQPSSQPPQVAGVSQGDLNTLSQLSASAQIACCNEAAPYMVAYGQGMAANPGGYAAPPVPPIPACSGGISNLQGFARTLGNGSWIQDPAAQQWLTSQAAGVANCVGGQMQQAGLPVGPQSYSQYYAPAMAMTQQLGQGMLGSAGPYLSAMGGAPVALPSLDTSVSGYGTPGVTVQNGMLQLYNPNAQAQAAAAAAAQAAGFQYGATSALTTTFNPYGATGIGPGSLTNPIAGGVPGVNPVTTANNLASNPYSSGVPGLGTGQVFPSLPQIPTSGATALDSDNDYDQNGAADNDGDGV